MTVIKRNQILLVTKVKVIY